MTDKIYDVAIIGAGMSGMATAMRLQAAGLSTIVLESHGQPGGCAGYYSRRGFHFDAGATTLVDFTKSGIGGDFLTSIGMDIPKGEYLDYVVWLPDRNITLFKDQSLWVQERLTKLGNTKNHLAFWNLLDKTASVFWAASRKSIKLPVQNISDVYHAIRSIGLNHISLIGYRNKTMMDVLQKYHLQDDIPLKTFLNMLIEDTLHSNIKDAPFINASLGIMIRQAGLMRAEGGMKHFWNLLKERYTALGGELKTAHKVLKFNRNSEHYFIETRKGVFTSKYAVSAVPNMLTYQLGPDEIKEKIKPYLPENINSLGGAILICMGVPENEVENHPLSHHQLSYDYNKPMGEGNNMFISVSAKHDLLSAPAGFRSVMISTHTDLASWQNITPEEYDQKKNAIHEKLILLARRIYPTLGENALVNEIAAPGTFYKFTGRPMGTVGGFKQNLSNTNQKAMPQNIGISHFYQVGDTTWPGLGTVACLIGSKIASAHIISNISK